MWWSCLALLPFAVACPEGFREFKEGCYMFTEEQGSMTQCQDRICTSKGATLAVVHDVEVQFFLSNLTHEYQAPAFLGLFERGSNESGDWTWIDGSNMTFETDVNETVNPLAGWAFSEPDNWCLDEDCAALGVDYIANYSEMKFGMFAQLLRPARSVGFFDISCSTQLHCLCQTGNVVSEDFLLWEFNNSATQDENSLHVNKTYWENYATCFHKRTRCWWYTDNNFQMTFVLVSVLCLTGIVFSMTGCSGGVQREVTLNDATAASNYGQLLEACDRQSEVDSTVDRWIVRGAWASMLYGVMLVLLSLTTMCAVTAPGDTEPRPLWSEPRDDDVTYEAELAVTSRTSDMSLFSDLTPPTTTLLQREDEAAYQAALAKARRLQNRETKRLTRQVSSGHTEHWQIRLRDFMQTALMESICAGVIFTNSILIGVQTDYMAKRLGEEQPLVFTVVDAAYTAIFGLELSVRLLGSGLGFFYRDPGLFWNYLDVIIVLPSIMELVLAFFLQLPAVSTDITVIRILRITRVFRVIRVVKVMKFVRSLRQLVESVMHTMRSLAWSMLLLIVIIYVFAIMFTDASASFQEFSPESVLNADLKSYFGDLHTSMHTLFRSVSGGIDWGMVAHPLGEVHWIWMYLFSLYVAFCMFAVLNVMTGIFCQVAVKSSWNDPQLLLQHSMVERERQHDLIRQLFQSFRQETTRRKITLIDIEENFDDDGVQGLMNLLDIYPETGWSLFKQLDDNGDASISEEEFVSGVFRLKGAAKSWDMEIIMQEQRGLRKILDTYIATVAGSDKRRAATASG